MPNSDFNISAIKQGGLRSDYKVENTEFEGYDKIDLENQKTRINFADGLNKDETERIILEINLDGDDTISEKEIKEFAKKYEVDTGTLTTIIKGAIEDIDETNTTYAGQKNDGVESDREAPKKEEFSQKFFFETAGITEKEYDELSSGKTVTKEDGTTIQLSATKHIQIYDNNGKLIKEVYKDNEENMRVTTLITNNKNEAVVEYMTYSGKTALSNTTKYINKDKETTISLEKEYNIDGSPKQSLLFEYDKEGAEIRNKIFTLASDFKIESTENGRTYYYRNEKGELVATKNIEDLF